MKTLWATAALACAVAIAVPGCKSNKREPVPGPTAGREAISAARMTHAQPDAIAWFQGSVEEAFARTALRRSLEPAQAHAQNASAVVLKGLQVCRLSPAGSPPAGTSPAAPAMPATPPVVPVPVVRPEQPGPKAIRSVG